MVSLGSPGEEGRVGHVLDARWPALGGDDLAAASDPASGDGGFNLLPGGGSRPAIRDRLGARYNQPGPLCASRQ